MKWIILLLSGFLSSIISTATPPVLFVGDAISTKQAKGLFKDAYLTEGKVFNQMVKTENVKALQKWIGAVGPDNKDILLFYLFIMALEEKKYVFARRLLDNITKGKLTNFLVGRFFASHLHKIRMEAKPPNMVEYDDLVDKAYQLFYGVGPNAHPCGTTDFLKNIDDKYEIQLFYTARTGNAGTDDGLMKVTFGFMELVHMLLINRKANSPTDYEEKLAKLDMYKNTQLFPTPLKIYKEMKVPMLFDVNSRPRRKIYGIVNQAHRGKYLDQIKLHGSANDAKIYSLIYDGDEKMTIREALAGKNVKMVENFFLRNDIGEYKADWITFAIKFSNVECMEVLLQERVPLPDGSVYENAAAKFKACIDTFKIYYKDRICIDGPYGCDPKKMVDPEKEEVVFSDSEDENDTPQSASGTSGGGGTTLNDETDPFYASECDPTAAAA